MDIEHRIGLWFWSVLVLDYLLSLLLFVSAAEEYLSFAFEHCHRSSQKNKRMILIYLLPVKMLLVSRCYSCKLFFRRQISKLKLSMVLNFLSFPLLACRGYLCLTSICTRTCRCCTNKDRKCWIVIYSKVGKKEVKLLFVPPCLILPLWKVELEVTAIRKISASLESSNLACTRVPSWWQLCTGIQGMSGFTGTNLSCFHLAKGRSMCK